MDPEVANCLRDAQNIEQTMFREFVSERIEKATKPLSDVIPRARLYTFSNRPPTYPKKSVTKHIWRRVLQNKVKHCTHHQAISFPEDKAWCRHRWNLSIMGTRGNHLLIKPREIKVWYQVYTSEFSANYAQSWMHGCFSGIYSGSIRYGGNHSHGDPPTRITLWRIYTNAVIAILGKPVDRMLHTSRCSVGYI